MNQIDPNDGRAACDYCRSGEVFRPDQNCPRCGRAGHAPEGVRPVFSFGAEVAMQTAAHRLLHKALYSEQRAGEAEEVGE